MSASTPMFNGVRGSSPDVETTPDIDLDRLLQLLPPYKVILHNDDHHDMDYVIYALTKAVPSLKVGDAIHIMMTAHSTGTAVVIVCPKETAEFYQDRIQSYGLTCTIEPDDS